MLFEVGVSCRVSYSSVGYLFVSCSGLISSVGEESGFCQPSFTCYYVVSVRRGFLFLWYLGWVALFLLHSLGLPYNN